VTEFISAALDSVLNQTFRNFEIILVNDGCPDTRNLERALAPYSDKIVYIVQENQGPAAARNSAILASRAPLIAMLDGDDFWEPNYLQVQVEYLEANPEVDVAYPEAWLFGDTAAGRLHSEFVPSDAPNFINVAARRCHIFYGVTARKAAVMSAGFYDPALRSGEDLDLWLRMLHAGCKFASHGIPLVHYRQRSGSLTDNRFTLGDLTLGAYQKLLSSSDLSADERKALKEGVDRTIASVDLVAGKKALYGGDFDEALKRFSRANSVLNTTKLRVAIALLRVCPQLLHAYLHRRYPTEHIYLH
jgi:glycosyltransferase involved in cell wall biosynthesis